MPAVQYPLLAVFQAILKQGINMRGFRYLLKRNILLFMRDYSAVFFSVMSMLIVLALMIIFLGSMNSQNVVEALAEFGGNRNTAEDEKNASYLIQMWTFAGILVVNAVTVTLTVMGTMVQDESKNKLAGFYVAPIKRITIVLGYIISSWIIGMGMCLLTFAVGEGYMMLRGYPLIPAMDCLILMGMIALNVFVYASLAYLLALFIQSESAWSGMLTIVGTLVGFVGAVYLPMSMLPESVGNAIKCLPILHGTAMMRKVLIKDAMAETFAGLPTMAGDIFKEQMGVSILQNGKEITMQYQIVFLAACGIMAIIAAILISKRKKVRDR